MSQVSTVLVEDVVEKEGATNGKAWKRYGLKDGNGDWYSTFESGVITPGLKGQRVEVEWEANGNFKNLLRATPQDAKPEPGTGNYIKGKEAPETQRNIRASVALENAVAWCIGNDETRATLSEHGVVKVARVFYNALQELAEGNAPAGQTTSPSSDEVVL